MVIALAEVQVKVVKEFAGVANAAAKTVKPWHDAHSQGSVLPMSKNYLMCLFAEVNAFSRWFVAFAVVLHHLIDRSWLAFLSQLVVPAEKDVAFAVVVAEHMLVGSASWHSSAQPTTPYYRHVHTL